MNDEHHCNYLQDVIRSSRGSAKTLTPSAKFIGVLSLNWITTWTCIWAEIKIVRNELWPYFLIPNLNDALRQLHDQ